MLMYCAHLNTNMSIMFNLYFLSTELKEIEFQNIFQMDKRMALAISADDVAPEVAETCFGNVGQVEDDDSADDDSTEETSNEKNRPQSQPTTSGGKKLKQNSLLQSNQQLLVERQQTSNPNSGET